MTARHLLASTRRTALVALASGALALTASLSSAAPAPAAGARPASTGVSGEWPQLQGGASHTGAASDTTLDRAALRTLTPVWTHPGGNFSAPVVSGGVVYLQGLFDVTALRLTDGSVLWRTALPNGGVLSAPAVDGGVVVVGGSLAQPTRARGGAVWGLDAATGALLWTHYFKRLVTAPPAISGQGVYVSADGVLRKLWLRSGGVAWTSTAQATSSPSIERNRVLVTTTGNAQSTLTVSSVDTDSGAVRWTRPLSTIGGCYAWAVGTVLLQDGVGYAGDCYGRLRALGASGARPVWTETLRGRSFFWPMAASDGLLFSVTDSQDAIAVDQATGAVRWASSADPGLHYWASPVVVGDTLLLPGSGGIDLRDTATGDLVGSLDLGPGDVLYPAVAEGHVLVVTDAGLVALAPA